MRIFKYWALHKATINIFDKKQISSVYGGSNISIEDTKKDADRKFKLAQKRIKNGYLIDDSYEVDIIEEIIDQIDNENIITRNRYGALVLNSTNTMFIDVDLTKATLFDSIFRRRFSKKELLLNKIKKTAKKTMYSHLGFRIYETKNGYRVAVLLKEFDPRSKESKMIMKDFRVDYLYHNLCLKQNCYRARLTPKPYRIKQKGMRIIFPNRNSVQEMEHNKWVNSYNSKSQQFGTCKLVTEYGTPFISKVIRHHDKLTKATKGLRLA